MSKRDYTSSPPRKRPKIDLELQDDPEFQAIRNLLQLKNSPGMHLSTGPHRAYSNRQRRRVRRARSYSAPPINGYGNLKISTNPQEHFFSDDKDTDYKEETVVKVSNGATTKKRGKKRVRRKPRSSSVMLSSKQTTPKKKPFKISMIANNHIPQPQNGPLKPLAVAMYRLQIGQQPPVRTVYKRIIKPYPVIMLIGPKKPNSNFFVQASIVRQDYSCELSCLDGHRIVPVFSGVWATFKKLKILATMQQAGCRGFRLKFQLKEFVKGGDTMRPLPGACTYSNVIQVYSHTQYLSSQDSPAIVNDIIPGTGPPAGGIKCVIFGSSFLNSKKLRVKFGDLSVPASFHDLNSIICTVPKQQTDAAVVPISVSNNGKDFSPSTEITFRYVRYPDFKVLATPNSLVSQVKAAITGKKGIPPEKQFLSHNGRPLEDDKPLKHYNIRKGATLDLSGTPVLPPQNAQLHIDGTAGGSSSIQRNLVTTQKVNHQIEEKASVDIMDVDNTRPVRVLGNSILSDSTDDSKPEIMAFAVDKDILKTGIVNSDNAKRTQT